MKKLLVIAMATFLFTANSNAQVKRNVNPSQKIQQNSTHRKKDGKRDGKMMNLTPDQKTKMNDIRNNFKQQRDAIKNDASLTQEQKMQKSKELRKSQQDQMKSILTPDQQAKMKTYKAHQKKGKKMKGQKRVKAPNSSQSTLPGQKDSDQ